MQPLLPGVFRKALKDFELGGYSIKAGTPLSLNLMGATETDPAWADLPPDSPFAVGSFNPDRWAGPGSQPAAMPGLMPLRHQFVLLPMCMCLSAAQPDGAGAVRCL